MSTGERFHRNGGATSIEELVYGQRRVSVVDGHQLDYCVPHDEPPMNDPRLIRIPCVGSSPLLLTDAQMSSHMLLVGRTGSGKTGLARRILAELRRLMSPTDICVVLDIKGDYARLFARPQDIVIGAETSAEAATWNLFVDLWKRGTGRGDVQEYVLNAVGKLLFEDVTRHPGANPFFGQGAEDVFKGVLLHLLREPEVSNASLCQFWDTVSLDDLHNLLANDPRTHFLTDYVSPEVRGQALGILAQLKQVVKDVFQGAFARPGSLSIRDEVQKKGGRILFIDFPVSTGATLGPGFRTLVDLAIREAIAVGEREIRQKGQADGRCYFLIDEASRLGGPLLHLEEGLNEGRELGLRFLLGIQSHTQLSDAFGHEKAASILAGLNNVFAFHSTESETREFVKHLCGRCWKRFVVPNVGIGDHIQQVFEADVLGDHDIWGLRPGEAVVIMPGTPGPFQVRFERFAMPNYGSR